MNGLVTEGREEGRKEGRKEVRKEGKKEGRKEGKGTTFRRKFFSQRREREPLVPSRGTA